MTALVRDPSKHRPIGRPSKTEVLRPKVAALLAEDPRMLSLEVLRRVQQDGYRGGKSALYALVAELRPEPPRPVVRFEGLPGEFSQHDFGQVDVRFIDGSKKRIHFFASRLKYSRAVDVTIVANERVETLVRTLTEHFEGFGGIPLLAVFDRPKTIAKSWRKDGTVTEWNSTFASVTLDLGLGVELAWPARGNQKGAVENLVGWVKGSFFKQRRFVDEDDLRAQLRAWLHEANDERPSRATGVVPAVRLAEERARLRPLRVTADELALRFPIVVGVTGYVLHETNLYSMPPASLGIGGTLYLHRDRVRIVAGAHEAQHPRLSDGHKQKSTLPEHRTAAVAATSGKRGKRYLKRQHLLELGPHAHDYLTEITHRRPNRWSAEVDALHELLQRVGAEPLRRAFAAAVEARTFGLEYVRHHLAATYVAPQQELPL